MPAGAWNVTANVSGIARRSDRLAVALALSRVNSSIGCALIWALLFAATCTLAQMPPSVRHAIDVYRNAIAEAESAATPHGIESAFAAIQDLREVLFADVPDGTLSVLDSLPEADFALLEQLPGVRVRRIEVLVVHPDADFYVELSAQVGDEADQRFAATLAATLHYGYWPVYVQPQTEYSGCTAFGEGRLLKTLLAWSAMERDFPGRYVSAVARERDAVVRKITNSTCACGDVASVVGEFERIAAALTAADPIRAAVDERLAALDEGRSNMRFGCISG